jgi:diketogulonate reductase-like aldo/keto reductase
MESLKEAVEEGLTTAVGVSNYSQYQMEEADDLLARYGIPLASNQVQYRFNTTPRLGLQLWHHPMETILENVLQR